MLSIQENIEALYHHVKKGESNEALREIQTQASKAFPAALQRNKIVFNLEADVEMLCPPLTEGAGKGFQ